MENLINEINKRAKKQKKSKSLVYSIRLDENIINDFKSYCNNNGLEHNEVIKIFMEMYVKQKD